MKRNNQKFLRTDSHKYSKLGVRRKKKQVYRKSKGGENKIRLNMKGHLRNVRSGFRNEKSTRGLLKGLKPVMIFNINDLKNIKKEEIGILASVGNKRKKEIAEYMQKEKISLGNFNPVKFIEKFQIKKEQRQEEKKERIEKKLSKDKKAKKEAEKEAKAEHKEAETETKSAEAEHKKHNEHKENKELETEKQNKQEIQTNNYGRGK
ncbi:MAG: eL32 family ribosomal protein [Nanoarchaeota archaeon]